MRRSWVRWTIDVLRGTSQQAKFEQFVEFFRYVSEGANSLGGKAVYFPVNFTNFDQVKKVVVFGTIQNQTKCRGSKERMSTMQERS